MPSSLSQPQANNLNTEKTMHFNETCDLWIINMKRGLELPIGFLISSCLWIYKNTSFENHLQKTLAQVGLTSDPVRYMEPAVGLRQMHGCLTSQQAWLLPWASIYYHQRHCWATCSSSLLTSGVRGQEIWPRLCWKLRLCPTAISLRFHHVRLVRDRSLNLYCLVLG